MDALEQMLVGRDRTYSTVVFEYGERTVIADVAHDEHCELPAVFERLNIVLRAVALRHDAQRVSGREVETNGGSPSRLNLEDVA